MLKIKNKGCLKKINPTLYCSEEIPLKQKNMGKLKVKGQNEIHQILTKRKNEGISTQIKQF